MQSPYWAGGEDVEKIRVGCYPPLVCVETAVGHDARVTVASAPDRPRASAGARGATALADSTVADAPPDGARTGVDVQ